MGKNRGRAQAWDQHEVELNPKRGNREWTLHERKEKRGAANPITRTLKDEK